MSTTGPSILQATLNRYGLGSLVNWAKEAIVQGWTEEQVMLALYDRPEFNARFPAIKAREAKNLPPIGVEEYLQYEQGIYALNTQWGTKISKTMIDNMISNNKSFREAEEVVSLAAAAMYEDDSETKLSLKTMYPQITDGDLIMYWLDPKHNFGELQQKYRTAQLGGAALRAGYGEVTEQQARRLVETGMNRDQAISGFASLVENEELFRATIGTEDEITRDQQIELLAGNADVGVAVEKRKASRLAEYQGGSTFAAGEEGFALGSAPR